MYHSKEVLNYCHKEVISDGNFDDIKDCSKDLVVILQNIRSISKNFDEFAIFVQDLPLDGDILVLVETWNLFGDAPLIDGYNVYEYSTRLNKCSGVAMYVDEKLNSHRLINDELDTLNNNILDFLFVDTVIDKKTYTVGGIYRSPSANVLDFLKLWENILVILLQNNLSVFILGDFNINILDVNDNFVNSFIEINSKYGLRILVKIPTRVTSKSSSLLDIVLTNTYLDSSCYVVNSLITDHYMVLTSFGIHLLYKASSNNRQAIKCINYKNLEKFCLEGNFYDALNYDNLNDGFVYIINKFNNLIDNSTYYSLDKNRYKKPNQPWMSITMLKSLKRKNKLKCKLNKNPSNLTLKEKYTRYRNTFNMLLKSAKLVYYKDIVESAKGDYKKTWSVINSLMQKDTRRDNDPNSLSTKCEGKLIKGDKAIADYANSWFCKSGSTMNNQQYFLNARIKHTIFLNPVSYEEICAIIYGISNSKASGLDNISNWMIRRTPGLIPVLVILINRLFVTGCFPDCLKSGKIHLVYKGGSRSDIKNFRPITLISPLSKVIEKAIACRMNDFMKKHGLGNCNQYAFSKGKGCDDALYHITDYVSQSLDNKEFTIAASIDLEKAFDNVSHNLLLYKLQDLGFRGVCLSLLSTYLNERVLITSIRGVLSDRGILSRGVPQGSVLGPLLFNIFISDMDININGVNTINYADDNLTFTSGKFILDVANKLQLALDALHEWYKRNDLTINIRKSSIIIFGSKRRLDLIDLSAVSFFIGSEEIPLKKSIKYLGLILDSTLTWNEQISKVQEKTSYFIPIFYRLRHILDKDTLMTIFNTCYKAKLLYGLKFYGSTYKTHLNAINYTFRKVLRIIHFFKNQDSLRNILKNEKILDIYQLHVNEIMKCFLNIMSGRSCTGWGLYFQLYDSISCCYSLRKSATILNIVPKFNNDYGRFRLNVRINTLINYLFSKNINLMELNFNRFKECKKLIFEHIVNNDLYSVW